MLRPDEHALLTSAIRPPAGYTLDKAVGTTFTLDLVALMLTQLTFATHDMGEDIDGIASIALLDAVNRNAKNTTVFVHGGGINVPSKWRPLLALLEDCIVEVKAPVGGVFHPKFWALRFKSTDGMYLHRVLVLSRNLTFDRSWDTMLCLEESAGHGGGNTLSGEDFAEFLRSLPGMATRMPAGRGLDDLSNTLAHANFALPHPYTEAHVWAVGHGKRFEPGWSGLHALLLSPFLAKSVVNAIAASVSTLKVVSSQASLDHVGSPPANATFYTLNPVVDPERHAAVEDLDGESAEANKEARPELRGLHAKALIIEDRRYSRTFTGSSNATGVAHVTNIELNVELRGRKTSQNAASGIDAVWNNNPNDKNDLGLESLVKEYEPQPADPDEQVRGELEWELTHYHNRLSSIGITTTVIPDGAETFSLTVGVPEHDRISRSGEQILTTMRPITSGITQQLPPSTPWQAMSVGAVTPYCVATSTIARSNVEVSSSCVLLTELRGDIPDRRDRVLKDILKETNILAYLAFLLANPADEGSGMGVEMLDRLSAATAAKDHHRTPLVIFEPMIHAALRDPAAIERVSSLIAELERLGEVENLPPAFLELWSVAQAASGIIG
jgi:hypothetical protein